MIVYQFGVDAFDENNYSYKVIDGADKQKRFDCRVKGCPRKIRIYPTKCEIIETHDHLPRLIQKHFLECLRAKQEGQTPFENFEKLYQHLMQRSQGFDRYCLTNSKKWQKRCWVYKSIPVKYILSETGEYRTEPYLIKDDAQDPAAKKTPVAKKTPAAKRTIGPVAKNTKKEVSSSEDKSGEEAPKNRDPTAKKTPAARRTPAAKKIHKEESTSGESSGEEDPKIRVPMSVAAPKKKEISSDTFSRNKDLDAQFQKRLEALLTQKAYTLYNVYSKLCDEFGPDICNRRYQQTFISLAKIQAANDDDDKKCNQDKNVIEDIIQNVCIKKDSKEFESDKGSDSKPAKNVSRGSKSITMSSRNIDKSEMSNSRSGPKKNSKVLESDKSEEVKKSREITRSRSSNRNKEKIKDAMNIRSLSRSRSSLNKYSLESDNETSENVKPKTRNINNSRPVSRAWESNVESESDSLVETKNYTPKDKHFGSSFKITNNMYSENVNKASKVISRPTSGNFGKSLPDSEMSKTKRSSKVVSRSLSETRSKRPQNVKDSKLSLLERWKQILEESEQPFLKQFSILESEYGKTLCQKERLMCQELWKLSEGTGTPGEKREPTRRIRNPTGVTSLEFQNRALALISGSKITLLSLSESLKREFGLITWKKYRDLAESLWTKEMSQPERTKERSQSERTKDEKANAPGERFENELRRILSGPKISYDELVKRLLRKFNVNIYTKYQELTKSMWKVSQSLDSESSNDSSDQSEEESDHRQDEQSDVGSDHQDDSDFEDESDHHDDPDFQEEGGEDSDMASAILAVQNKIMGTEKAAKRFQVSRHALRRRLRMAQVQAATDQLENGAAERPKPTFDSYLPQIQNKLYDILSEKHMPFKVLFKILEDHFGKKICQNYEKICYLWWEQEDLGRNNRQSVMKSAIDQMEEDLHCDNYIKDVNAHHKPANKKSKEEDQRTRSSSRISDKISDESEGKLDISRNNKNQEKSREIDFYNIVNDKARSKFQTDNSNKSKVNDKKITKDTANDKVNKSKSFHNESISEVNNKKVEKSKEMDKVNKSKSFYDEDMSDMWDSDDSYKPNENDRPIVNTITETFQQKFKTFNEKVSPGSEGARYRIQHKLIENTTENTDDKSSTTQINKHTKNDLDGGDMCNVSEFLSNNSFVANKETRARSKYPKLKSLPRTSTRIFDDDKGSDISDLFLSDDSETNEGYRSKTSRRKIPIRKRKPEDQLQDTIQKRPKRETEDNVDQQLFLKIKGLTVKRKAEDDEEKQIVDFEDQVTKNIVLKPKTDLQEVATTNKGKKNTTNVVEVTNKRGDKIIKQVIIQGSSKKKKPIINKVQEEDNAESSWSQENAAPDKFLTPISDRISQKQDETSKNTPVVEKTYNSASEQQNQNVVLKDESILKLQELLKSKRNIKIEYVHQSREKRNIITESLSKVYGEEVHNKLPDRYSKKVFNKLPTELKTFTAKSVLKTNKNEDIKNHNDNKSERREIKEKLCKKLNEMDEIVNSTIAIKNKSKEYLFPTPSESVTLGDAYSFLTKQDREEDLNPVLDKETMVFDQFVSNLNRPNHCCLTFVSPSVIEIVKGMSVDELNLQIDCSFEIEPKRGQKIQLVMINALNRGACFPLLWALATAASTECFILIMLQLKTIIPKIKSLVTDVHSDALTAAIRVLYPDVKLKGYWFYLGRSLYLKADALGLLSEEDDIALDIVKRGMAVSLLPLDQMEQGVQILTTYILEKGYIKPAVLGFLHYLSELASVYTKHFKDYVRKYNAADVFSPNLVAFLTKEHANSWFCIQDLLRLEVIDYCEMKMVKDTVIGMQGVQLLNEGNIKDFMERMAEFVFSNVSSVVVETKHKGTVKSDSVPAKDASTEKVEVKLKEKKPTEKIIVDSKTSNVANQPQKNKNVLVIVKSKSEKVTKLVSQTKDSDTSTALLRSTLGLNLSSSTGETSAHDSLLIKINATDLTKNEPELKSMNNTKEDALADKKAIAEKKGNLNKLSDSSTPVGTNKSQGPRSIDIQSIMKSSREPSSDTFRSLQRNKDGRPITRNVAIIAPNNDLMTEPSKPLTPKQTSRIIKTKIVSKKDVEHSPSYRIVPKIIKNPNAGVQNVNSSFDLGGNDSNNGNVIEFVEEEENFSDENQLEYDVKDGNEYDDAMEYEENELPEDDDKNMDETEYEQYEYLEENIDESAENSEDDGNIEYEHYESLDTYLTDDEANDSNSAADSEGENYEYDTDQDGQGIKEDETYEVDDTANYIQIEEVDEKGNMILTYLPKNVQRPTTTVPQKVTTVVDQSSSRSQELDNRKKVLVPFQSNQKYFTSIGKSVPLIKEEEIHKPEKIKILNQTVLGTSDPKFALKRGPHQEIQICGVVDQDQHRKTVQRPKDQNIMLETSLNEPPISVYVNRHKGAEQKTNYKIVKTTTDQLTLKSINAVQKLQGQPIILNANPPKPATFVNGPEQTKSYDTTDLLDLLEGGNIDISQDQVDAGHMDVMQVLNDADGSILNIGGNEEFSLVTFGENVPRVVLERDLSQKLNVCGLLSNDAFISPGSREFQDQLELILTTDKAKQLLS